MKFYSRDWFINTGYHLLVKNNKGEGRGGVFLTFFPEKKGGLIWERGLNRGFTVLSWRRKTKFRDILEYERCVYLKIVCVTSAIAKSPIPDGGDIIKYDANSGGERDHRL